MASGAFVWRYLAADPVRSKAKLALAVDLGTLVVVDLHGPLEPRFLEGEAGLELVASDEAVYIYRRARVLRLARLVYQVEVVEDAETAIARIYEPDFHPQNTAILDQPLPCEIGPYPATPGVVRVLEARPGYWRIDVESESPALLMLAEIAYPGWQVTVDGIRTEWLTAYAVLRSVCVPAGKHLIEWRFDPLILKVGAVLTLSVLGLLVGASVVIWRHPAKR